MRVKSVESGSGAMFWAGVDVGAATTKAAILDEKANLVSFHVQKSGVDYVSGSRECLERALERGGISEDSLKGIVATGYGRYNVPGAKLVKTEISCHTKGCFFHFPEACTIVDIGGQDCKVIRVDETGKRTAFKMNRKCAAGTGAFLEEVSLRLGLDVSQLDSLARVSTKRIKLGSYCTVFTSTEILALIRKGEKVEDIVRGLFEAIAQRLLEMDPLQGTVVMTGGVVAHNPVLVDVLGEKIPGPIKVPPNPQLIGAFGAALYGLEQEGESISEVRRVRNNILEGSSPVCNPG